MVASSPKPIWEDAVNYRWLKPAACHSNVRRGPVDRQPTPLSRKGLNGIMNWYTKKANLNTWRTTFGPQYDVPQEVLDLVSKGVLKDTSWGNDLCPSFMTPDEKLQLWVDHPDENERESPSPRFGVSLRHEDGGVDSLASTDNLQEALAVILRGGNAGAQKPQPSKSRVEELRERLYDIGNKNDPRAKPLLKEYSKLTSNPAPKFMF